MRIALISQPRDMVVPPVQTSLGIWTYEVAARLAKTHKVIVYARGGRLGRTSSEHHGNVQVRRVSTGLDARLLRLLQNLPRARNAKRPLFSSALYYLGYVTQVALDLRLQRCDVVQFFNYSQMIPILRALNPTSRIVLHMECDWLNQLDHSMIAQRIARCDLVISCSDYLTSRVRDRFPEYADRCRTVYNGVSLQRFSDGHRVNSQGRNASPRVLFVGRISPEKGIHVLLDAFERVAEQYPGAQLSLVGDTGQCPRELIVDLSDEDRVRALARFYDQDHGDSYRFHLQRQIDRLSCAKQVTFAGYVPQTELAACYAETDVLVNPSFSEAFGMTLVEAMAAGVPVVATRVGGMVDIVQDGGTGILVEPGDVTALADALLRLLSDPALQERLSSAAKKRVAERFSWERVTESLLQQYGSLGLETRSRD